MSKSRRTRRNRGTGRAKATPTRAQTSDASTTPESEGSVADVREASSVVAPRPVDEAREGRDAPNEGDVDARDGSSADGAPSAASDDAPKTDATPLDATPARRATTASDAVEAEVDAMMAAPVPEGAGDDAPFVSPPAQARLALPGTPAPAARAALANPKADIAALDELERHLFAHRYAEIGIECYSGSIDPEAATADSGEVLAILGQEDQELLCSPATGDLLDRLETQHAQLLSDAQRAQVRVLKRDRAALVDVPSEEQAAFTRLTSEALAVWRKAKAAGDWEGFAPHLDRVVAAMRSIASHRRPDADPYDVWLDEFEHGTDRAFYDRFFAQVKEVVVPLVMDVTAKGRHPSRRVIEGRFDERRQWALARDLMELEGLDPCVVFLTTTEHPYSDALTSHYAIIATHVYEDDVCSNVFSMLHEGGHALYETGVNPAFDRTSLKGGTSMGMHEAQSRFFENYVGRAEAFVPTLLGVLRRHFPGQFGRVTTRQLYLAINRAEPGPVRIEADELTYPLHVLVRYEIEQLLMAGEAKAADVPGLWREKYQAYLGVRVPDDAHGALQDVHWSQGSIGYFPTYALGSAFGAQLKAAMVAGGMDFDGVLASGDLSPIRDWLRERIWRHGRAKDSGELIRDACGEAFDASYYTDYLRRKFSAIYGL